MEYPFRNMSSGVDYNPNEILYNIAQQWQWTIHLAWRKILRLRFYNKSETTIYNTYWIQ